MYKYVRNIDFLCMFILGLLEISSFIIYFLVLISTFHLDKNTDLEREIYFMNLLDSILSMFLSMTSVWFILVFGIHSLYFKVIERLIFYIISALIIPFAIWLLYTLEVIYTDLGNPSKKSEIKDILHLRSIALPFNYVETTLFLISLVLTIIERKTLLREISTSPLNTIDESLTEELYKNIIQQSKDPNNEKLLDEFNRLTSIKERNSQNSKDKVGGGNLNDSNGSGLLRSSKANGSINPNAEKTISSRDRTKPLLNSGFDSPPAKD